jgi:hypothetical protein
MILCISLPALISLERIDFRIRVISLLTEFINWAIVRKRQNFRSYLFRNRSRLVRIRKSILYGRDSALCEKYTVKAFAIPQNKRNTYSYIFTLLNTIKYSAKSS